MKKQIQPIDTTCPHCGAQMKEWWHRLTPGLVSLLFASIAHVKQKGVNIIEKNEVCKTNSECCNYNKLRYFGLIAYARDADGNRIDGVFVLTRNAGSFLRGEIKMPCKVKTYRNELIGKSDEEVTINAYRHKMQVWFDHKEDFEFDIHDGRVVFDKVIQSKLNL
jgi:hypothetical protein